MLMLPYAYMYWKGKMTTWIPLSSEPSSENAANYSKCDKLATYNEVIFVHILFVGLKRMAVAILTPRHKKSLRGYCYIRV